MYITAKVIADSIANGHTVTTLELEYPRYIHSELMTHRVFSRNAASSRAIPFDKMLQTITSMDQTPKWTLNQKGMVGIPATTLIPRYSYYVENFNIIQELPKGLHINKTTGEIFGIPDLSASKSEYWVFGTNPDGYDKTMGCFKDEERCFVWNTDAYYELSRYLENQFKN